MSQYQKFPAIFVHNLDRPMHCIVLSVYMGLFDSIKTAVSGKPLTPNTPTKDATTAKKVLIVEDDEALRNFYVELLTTTGYTVIQADNGQSGLETLVAQKPNLVLLDLMMPVMDGKMMLHKIREMPEFKSLPVIVLTNAGDVESMNQTRFYDNANEFLIKSNVSPEEIIQKIKMFLNE